MEELKELVDKLFVRVKELEKRNSELENKIYNLESGNEDLKNCIYDLGNKIEENDIDDVIKDVETLEDRVSNLEKEIGDENNGV